MRLNTRLFGMLLCIIPVLFSCEKEKDTEELIPVEPEKKVWSVTIDAQKVAGETKALTLSGNTISATWTVGDVVKVYKSGQLLGELSALSSGKTTKLSGSLEGDLSVEDELRLFYSSKNYGEQDGTLEGIAANCDGAEAYVSVIGFVGNSVKTSSASFQSQQAITRITFLDNNGNTLTPTRVVIRQTSSFGLDSGAFSGASGTLFAPGTIYVNNTQRQNNLYIALDYNTQITYLFVVYVGDDVYTGEKTAKLSDGKYYITNVTVSPYTPEYVDMGLSVKWAKCNLGAYYPTSGGDYYAWGEVTPKTDYTWDNYVWGTWSMDNSTISKYNLVDRKETLDMDDDAAHHRLGLGWWVPSKENWEELFDEKNCTWQHYNYASYGPGMLVTSKITGNWIFLPAAGCVEEGILFYTDNSFDRYFLTNFTWDTQYPVQCNYWSATRTSYDTHYHCGEAVLAEKNNLTGYTAHCHRMIGMSIRPVYSEPITQVTFNSSSVSLPCWDYSKQLEYTVFPETGTARVIQWESSDPTTITVDQNGKVTSVKTGTATITVTIDGEVTASCTVTASKSNENFLRYKKNYRDASYTNSHDSSRDRYYSSRLTGFKNAKVIEMKFKLNGDAGCLGSSNTFLGGAYISVSGKNVNCRDDNGNQFSFPISDYGISPSDLMILKYDGINHKFTINGNTLDCSSLTTFSFDYMLVHHYDDTSESSSDDDDEISYEGIPNNSKVYYIKAYNASNKAIRTGYRGGMRANSANNNTSEYCWAWSEGSSSTTTYEFASYSGFNESTYEPFEAE